mgnify:CR=1 FL=1
MNIFNPIYIACQQKETWLNLIFQVDDECLPNLILTRVIYGRFVFVKQLLESSVWIIYSFQTGTFSPVIVIKEGAWTQAEFAITGLNTKNQR